MPDIFNAGIPPPERTPLPVLLPFLLSGPLVFGRSPAASRLAIGATEGIGDRERYLTLLQSVALVGGPVIEEDKLRHTMMPTFGQAVTFFGKTRGF